MNMFLRSSAGAMLVSGMLIPVSFEQEPVSTAAPQEFTQTSTEVGYMPERAKIADELEIALGGLKGVQK
ncbi:MAG: hypothetical protein AAB459_02615 [Patescibacteria group bacterium]